MSFDINPIKNTPSDSSPHLSPDKQKTAHAGRKYITIDHNTIRLTSDRKLASTPKKILQFMKKHERHLGNDQLDLLKNISLKNGKVSSSQNETPTGFGAKIKNVLSSFLSFIKNLGATDSTLLTRIRKKTEYEKLANILEQKISSFGLATKLHTLLYLKSMLSDMKQQLASMDPQSDQAKDLQQAIADTTNGIAEREQALRSQNYRKQMLDALKELKLAEEDPPEVIAAKSKLQEEGLIHQMRALTSIRFQENAEVREINVRTKESKHSTVPINFSDKSRN